MCVMGCYLQVDSKSLIGRTPGIRPKLRQINKMRKLPGHTGSWKSKGKKLALSSAYSNPADRYFTRGENKRLGIQSVFMLMY